MLNQQPVIKEKENAVDFIYQGGCIELRDIGFKHLLTESPEPSKKKGSEIL